MKRIFSIEWSEDKLGDHWINRADLEACLFSNGFISNDDVRVDDAGDNAVIVAEELAILFHSIYERLAPQFGYETRKETREFDMKSSNGKLMIAVCKELLQTQLGVWWR